MSANDYSIVSQIPDLEGYHWRPPEATGTTIFNTLPPNESILLYYTIIQPCHYMQKDIEVQKPYKLGNPVGLACVIQSEHQIAKLLPTVLKRVLPNLHNYKEKRISLHAEKISKSKSKYQISKRYFKLFQDIVPYACCHLTSVQIFFNFRVIQNLSNALSNSPDSHPKFKQDAT